MNNTGGGQEMSSGQGSMSMPPIPTSPLWTPRISPGVYVGLQFFFMALAVVAAAARTCLRIRKFHRVTVDDCLLTVAVCFQVVGVSVSYQATSMAYWSIYTNLQLAMPPQGWGSMLMSFAILDNISNIFGWGAIFIVKISFLMFLRSLVTRVRRIHTWWWVVFAFVAMSTPVTMFLGFYICPYFTPESMASCGTAHVIERQFIFLTINCILDILSDVLILTIPCWLLWKVQISMRRKVALGTVLCLSIFMVIIAVIRVALDRIIVSTGAEAPDTVWLYFWTNIEGAVAIVMVSLTAFRSMLGQEGTSKGSASDGAASHYTPPGKEVQPSLSSSTPSATDRWAAESMTHNASDERIPTPHVPAQWIDPHANSIRKEVTIRTDYEKAASPQRSHPPPRNVRHMSDDEGRTQMYSFEEEHV